MKCLPWLLSAALWIGCGASKVAPHPPEDAPPTTAPPAERAPAAASIVEIEPRFYAMTPDTFARLIAAPADGAAPCIRVAAFTGSDGIKGLEVQEISAGSLCAQLRLQLGDVLTEVNGFPLPSMEEAAKVFEKLREATSFEALLDRRGAALMLRYQVRRGGGAP